MAGHRRAPSASLKGKPRLSPVPLRDIFIIRLVNALCLATFFQPDEFFQALEPAWRLAFGADSGAWLTWEWHHQLRSSLHPLLFSAAYTIADRLSAVLPPGSAVRSAIVIAAPRVLQALIAALGDWYTWHLAVQVYESDRNASFFALFMQLLNPWQWYCSTRTFSNSLETTLTVMALSYWPWQLLGVAPYSIKENAAPFNVLRGKLWRLRASLCLAALAVVLRPTNVLIWLTIVFLALTRISLQGNSPLSLSTVLVLFREAILCGSLVVGLSILADRLYFGFWTFPPYNWLNFNISKSLAVFYGRNPWHYYILQGIPLLCTTSLPFVIPALFNPTSKTPSQANILRTLSCTVLATVVALSLISHKEVRFIYPLLPVLSVLAAPRAASFFTTVPKTSPPPSISSAAQISAPPQPPPSSSSGTKSPTVRRARLRNKPLLLTALGINVLLAGYLSFLHQPAPLFLRKQYERIHPSAVRLAHETHYRSSPSPLNATTTTAEDRDALFALFLMPCHSTPWRSHLVYPGLSAYALTCEPPLHTQPGTPERDLYRDEADRFYDAPVPFLRGELFAPGSPAAVPVPRYIVGFEGVEPWLREFLETTPEGQGLGVKELRRVWAGFNGFFNEDWRRAGYMMVWDTGVYAEESG
ncbi:glycosyltransferase family 22 protein [Trichoderma citrinoviride]|uniref:Mannosyltransferase n=1 Tax=Trichoderma citrinoviride TaxID=58853 RepID=A0A2T4BET7_9HYPO|nr:glycosyltransferase family 22 protein [Trichoderma citrinoviride]PTB67852.1 glycosyltransferase family 22 protein [Trichoderma citrinoviride]